MTDAQRGTELYRLHAGELTRFATVLVGPADASDVVSEAVVSLLASGELTAANDPRALMYRAVLTKARSWQRSAVRRRRRERKIASRVAAEDPELRPEVVEAVARLSPQQRACVYLVYWEDLTVAQTAARLDIGEGSVKRYLSRARDKLRRLIDE